MERKVDFGQLYGYAVCLVAVVTFIISSVALVHGVLDLREPPYTDSYRTGPSLVSFGAYKLDLLRQVGADEAADVDAALLPPDSTLREMYRAERLDRLALAHQTSRSRIIANVILGSLAVVLFALHWAWLRRRERTNRPTP